MRALYKNDKNLKDNRTTNKGKIRKLTQRFSKQTTSLSLKMLAMIRSQKIKVYHN